MQPFFQWLIQEAELPFRSYRLWLKRLSDELARMDQTISDIHQIFMNLDPDDLDDYLPSFASSNIQQLDRNFVDRYISEDYYAVSVTQRKIQIKQLIEIFNTTNDNEYASKIVFDYIPHELKEIVDTISKLSLEDIQRYYLTDDVFHVAKDSGLDILSHALDELMTLFQRMFAHSEKIQGFIQQAETKNKWRWAAYQNPNKMIDDLVGEQIVYHASIDAKKIYETGFDLEYSGDQRGLGGGDSTKISTTLDFNIAKNIAKTFKILWMIANDRISPSRLLEHIKTDVGGNLDKVKQAHITKKDSFTYPPQSKAEWIEFYLTSLWFLSDSKIKHYVTNNPVFWNSDGWVLQNRLEDIDYSDIGILKISVDVREDDEFNHAESEILIGADRLNNIEQLIV